MDKVAIRVSGDPSFFADVAREAARQDRSPSWLLSKCLGETLPKLAGQIAAASPQRAAERPSSSPAKTRVFTFFVPRDLVEHCGRLAARLRLSSDDVVTWAWQAGRPHSHELPSQA